MSQMMCELLYVVGVIKSVTASVTASTDQRFRKPHNVNMVNEMVCIGGETYITEL